MWAYRVTPNGGRSDFAPFEVKARTMNDAARKASKQVNANKHCKAVRVSEGPEHHDGAFIGWAPIGSSMNYAVTGDEFHVARLGRKVRA